MLQELQAGVLSLPALILASRAHAEPDMDPTGRTAYHLAGLALYEVSVAIPGKLAPVNSWGK